MEYLRSDFFDIDEFCHAMETWDAEIYPLASTPTEEIVNSTIQTAAADSLFSSFYFSAPVKMHCAAPKELTTFNLMEDSASPYWCRGHDLTSEMAWVFPAGGEMESIAAPGFRVHTLSVTEQRIAEACTDCEIDLPPPSRRPEVFHLPYQPLNFLRSQMRGLANWPAGFIPETLDELLPLLVSHWLKPGTIQGLRRPRSRSRDKAVRKSLALIAEYDLGELTPGFLLERCHVSKRTLEYAFRERFDQTPAAFIKRLRMIGVRAALRQTNPTQPGVANIASRFGFWHMAQFAADYRKAFGELPSETLRNP